jgi:MFS family permease
VSTDTSNSPGARLSVFAPQFRPITLSTLTLIALAAFDGMAVSAALPKIGADLGVGRLPWVLTSFQLTSTISMLAAGPVIDAIGVRRAYRFCCAPLPRIFRPLSPHVRCRASEVES